MTEGVQHTEPEVEYLHGVADEFLVDKGNGFHVYYGARKVQPRLGGRSASAIRWVPEVGLNAEKQGTDPSVVLIDWYSKPDDIPTTAKEVALGRAHGRAYFLANFGNANVARAWLLGTLKL